jgi:hypothetical protein
MRRGLASNRTSVAEEEVREGENLPSTIPADADVMAARKDAGRLSA